MRVFCKVYFPVLQIYISLVTKPPESTLEALLIYLSFLRACPEEWQELVYFLHSRVQFPVGPEVMDLPHRSGSSSAGARTVKSGFGESQLWPS